MVLAAQVLVEQLRALTVLIVHSQVKLQLPVAVAGAMLGMDLLEALVALEAEAVAQCLLKVALAEAAQEIRLIPLVERVVLVMVMPVLAVLILAANVAKVVVAAAQARVDQFLLVELVSK